MAEKWDPVKDTIINVEETRPVAPAEQAQTFITDTANKLLEKLPDLKLPIPPPPWLLPDMTLDKPQVCTPGEEKCIGMDWCRCNPAGTDWIVLVKDSPSCEAGIETAVLYGVVTDKETGLPVEGIVVSCNAVPIMELALATNGYSTTTAFNGTFRIEDIVPGTYSVVFTDPLGRYGELRL